jgi:hypothetical protein
LKPIDIQSVVVASPKSTPVRLSVTALAPGRRVPAQSEEPPLDEPKPLPPLEEPDEPLDDPKPLAPPEEPDELPVVVSPLDVPAGELPPKVVLGPDAAPWAHTLWQAVQAVAPASPVSVETQLDSSAFEPQICDCAFGALKSPPGQMQPK